MTPNGPRLCEWVGGCSHYGHRTESKDPLSTMKLHNSHCDKLLLETLHVHPMNFAQPMTLFPTLFSECGRV